LDRDGSSPDHTEKVQHAMNGLGAYRYTMSDGCCTWRRKDAQISLRSYRVAVTTFLFHSKLKGRALSFIAA
jgi:hypothetical protein